MAMAQCPAVITPANPAPVCQPGSVLLTASSGTGFTYKWYRDNVEIPVPDPTSNTFQATTSGAYTVQVSGPTCATATSTSVQVVVNPALPAIDFTFNPNSIQCAGTPIVFTVTNPQPAEYTYIWDFGDGFTTQGSSITHAYKAVGLATLDFTVKVYRQSILTGCTSPEASKVVTVQAKPAFSPPTDSSNFFVCIPEEQDSISVQAALRNTTLVNGALSYVIDFGDGFGERTFTSAQFNATEPIRNIIPYDTTGTFPIKIRALGTNGCDSVYTRNFYISKKPKAHFSLNKERIDPPVPPRDCIPVKVTTDSDSTTGENLVYKWNVKNSQGQNATAGIYDYLESTTDTSKAPIYRFNVSGRYTLEMIVSNMCGSDTTTQSLLVGFPEIKINADTTACGPITFNFNDEVVTYDANLGTIDEASYEWTITPAGLGAVAVGGTTLRDKYPRILFPNPGDYTVTARVKNECGFSDAVGPVVEAKITVNPTPNAPNFGATSTSICSGDSTTIRPAGPGSSFTFYTVVAGGTALDTAATYNTGPLNNTTTFYVATLSAQGCESPTRTPFTVNVTQRITDNTISLAPNQREICANQAVPGTIAGSDPSGEVGFLWLSSRTSGTQGFTTAPSNNPTGNNQRNYATGPLTATTWFRRVALSGNSCPNDTTVAVMVTVGPPLDNNTITLTGGSPATICQGNEAPVITSSATTATIVWESSTTGPNANDFATAAGTNGLPTYAPGRITQTTWFRRRITAGACSSVSSAVVVEVIRAIDNNTIDGTQTICAGATPARLLGSTPTGGTSTNRYRWERSLTGNPSDFALAPGTSNELNYSPAALTQTTYFRRVVDPGSNCEVDISNTVVVTVITTNVNNTISAVESTICQGTDAVITGSVPTGSWTYQWESSTSGPNGVFAPIPNTNSASYSPVRVMQNTWYRRRLVSTSANCPIPPSNVVAITAEPAPAAPIVASSNVQSCQGFPATLRAIGPGGNYAWYSTPTGGNPLFIGSVFVTQALTQNTTFYVETISATECTSTSRTPVSVTLNTATADAGSDVTIMVGDAVTLRARGGVTYLWSPADSLSNPNVSDPVARPTATTTYTVTVTDANGCVDTDEVVVTVLPRVAIVNTFSPNNDGINDVWVIKNIESFPNATVEIFNRWGSQVFNSKGYAKPWDGTHNGKPLPIDTYYYIIRLDGNKNLYKGSVTIIR
ncbi:gliding motility-associated C-terminal domain-containing protein [Rufibacter sp. LB8]|uniref:Ig-like domain-containing protein n=2 Tax=Rufibacter sp. LB8 TaxID=2777781 RepID=UPI00178C719A|nr:gliding motility-associated C-terminal domain-containing protein [Rufibacter sp. LB8]